MAAISQSKNQNQSIAFEWKEEGGLVSLISVAQCSHGYNCKLPFK